MPFSSFSTADFEQVNVSWDLAYKLANLMFLSNNYRGYFHWKRIFAKKIAIKADQRHLFHLLVDWMTSF